MTKSTTKNAILALTTFNVSHLRSDPLGPLGMYSLASNIIDHFLLAFLLDDLKLPKKIMNRNKMFLTKMQ